MLMKRILIFCFLVFSGYAGEALACSCARSGTVDIEFERSPNVVILKLESVEKARENERTSGYGGIKTVELTVQRSFKGNLKTGQRLTLKQGSGADCVWIFPENGVGREYLFYLDSKRGAGGMWVGPTCSRSGSVEQAAADLLYLERRAEVKGQTRLSGTVTKYVESPVEEQPSTFERLPEHRIEVTGNGKTHSLVTDKQGVYEIYGLPPGRYNVQAKPIEGFTTSSFPHLVQGSVEIKAEAHTEKDFRFEIDSSISGKLIGPKGKPLQRVCLKLVPASGTVRQGFFQLDCTEAEGKFTFARVPVGEYLIYVNDDDEITADAPFRAFYYPSAMEREDAAQIQVAPGTKIDNILIVAPNAASVVTVTGYVLMSDGKPPVDEDDLLPSVEFIQDGETESSSRTVVDAEGRFSLPILKGMKGKIYGEIITYPGEYEDCPQLEKLIPEKDGVNIAFIKTNEVEVNTDADSA